MKKINLIKKEKLILAIIIIGILIASAGIIFSKADVKNGIWVKGDSMYEVDLDQLSNYGIDNIFLHSFAVDKYGQKNVEEWIAKANSKGIKVHIWVQCFYDNGSWVNPIDTNKKDFNYAFFDSKIIEIEKYAAIPGITGIHLDYIRYPGNAYKYDYSDNLSSSKAVSKFVSMVRDKIDSGELRSKNLVLSAAVMPEKASVKYYGQDPWTLSQSLDVIIPMAYTGNYNANAEWIKDISSYFTWNAPWANLCIGIQVYDGDNNVTPLSSDIIKKNSQAALDGGASGVALFNWELMKNWFDLRELW
ncbi:MAG: putative glycoside hydrolase [Methanobacteriaceae archaeon]